MTEHFDIRAVASLAKYGGNKEDFAQWRFGIEKFIGMQSAAMLRNVRQAARSAETIDTDLLDDAQETQANKLSFILSQTVTGNPLITVMNLDDTNDFEQYCILCSQEQPGGPANVAMSLV